MLNPTYTPTDRSMRRPSLWYLAGLALLLTCTACSPPDDDTTDSGEDAGADTAPADMASSDSGPGGETLFVARIIDQSDEENCGMDTETLDPGSDIFAVGLESPSGEPIAWATLAYSNVIAEDNDFSDPGPINGAAPELESDRACPDPLTDTNMVSLGCRGWIAVQFVDGAGDPIGLTAASGDRIRVYEADSQCRSDTSRDNYDLTLCSDAAAVMENGDPGSCDVPLLSLARGETFAPLEGF